jgi:hypothetical protein
VVKANRAFQSDVIMSAEAFRVATEVVEPLLTSPGRCGQEGGDRNRCR